MKQIVLLPAVLALLTACDKGVEMKNASVENVAKAVKDKGLEEKFVDPGKWEQVVTLLSIDAPGMGGQERVAMQQAIGQKQVHTVCLTPEKAKSPRADFLTGKDENCNYDHFKWGGGKIDMVLSCQHPNAKQKMALSGDYEPQRYSMAMTMTNEGGSKTEQFAMKMKVEAKRVGDCDAKAASN
jgi:hypothetical protein